jgi:uncharacterized membrane protein YoaK (UPF0700 family)
VAICVVLVAGYVDAWGIRVFGTYVSFMSGNTTQAGIMTGQRHLVAALPSGLAIAFFVAGSFAGTCVTRSGLRQSRRILFVVVAVLLAATIGVTQPGALNAKVGIVILSLAMGMMNTTVPRVGSEAVSLTFVTGDLNRVGSHLALAVMRAPLMDAQGSWDTHLRRAGLLAGVWTGFLTGAVLSAAASPYVGAWIGLPPILMLLTLGLFGEGGMC